MKMKKEGIIVLIALFALAFSFGCIGGGGEENETAAGNGYTINVNPKTVIAGGVITVELRLKNIFDNDMSDLSAVIKDLPSSFGTPEENTGILITRGQEYPIIWTIEAPETDLKQTVSPKIEVCFDYVTNFYFDTALVPKDKVTEAIQVQSGYSNGPIKVTQVGLDKIFLKDGTSYTTGSLNIQNNWQGRIERINEIKITPPAENVASEGVKYAKCGNDTTTSIKPEDTNCDILENKLAIGDGLTATVKITTDYDGSDIKVERTNGEINYTYCYEIPMGTITVCPVGQRC
ncbi:MAG: hypothetical protein J7K73_00070 [Nanoarchaeota archaeon]|nr:hypothetical protein [Nanoarchaeota archaeon]